MLRLGVAYFPVKTERFRVAIVPEINKILVGMFYDPDGTKSFNQLFQQELRDAWKSLGLEGTFRASQLALSVRAGYFEDLTGQRGGIVLEKDGVTNHVGIGDALTRTGLGDFKSLGLCYGGGIEYARFCLDISIDQMIYDFPTSNYKFSFSYGF